MVASGVPEPNVKNHAAEIVMMALKIINNVKKYTIPHIPDTKLDTRTGMHSGATITHSLDFIMRQ
jgi:NaMN:DMB phosphoribosyltransferase